MKNVTIRLSILTTKARVAGRRLDLKDCTVERQQRDVKRPA